MYLSRMTPRPDAHGPASDDEVGRWIREQSQRNWGPSCHGMQHLLVYLLRCCDENPGFGESILKCAEVSIHPEGGAIAVRDPSDDYEIVVPIEQLRRVCRAVLAAGDHLRFADVPELDDAAVEAWMKVLVDSSGERPDALEYFLEPLDRGAWTQDEVGNAWFVEVDASGAVCMLGHEFIEGIYKVIPVEQARRVILGVVARGHL